MAEEKSVDRIAFSLQVSQDNTEIENEPLLVLFGEVKDQRFKRLARQAFEKYPYPILMLSLEVAVGNAGAIALFKKLGFSQLGMYTDYYDGHTDALSMQKILVASKSVKLEVYP